MIEARDEKGDRAVTHNPRTTQPLVLATGVTRLTFQFSSFLGTLRSHLTPSSLISLRYGSGSFLLRSLRPDRTG